MQQPNFDAVVNDDRFSRGIPNSEDACPIAIAVQETFQALFPTVTVERVLVGDMAIHIHTLDAWKRNNVLEYECNNELGEWVNDFDEAPDEVTHPITVRLENGSAFIAWNAWLQELK